MDFGEYYAVETIDDWGFTEEQIEQAESFNVEEDEETGNLYLQIFDESDTFIAEIEFSPNEADVMQAYIDEVFDVDYENEIYSPDWEMYAKMHQPYKVDPISTAVVNNALDTIDGTD